MYGPLRTPANLRFSARYNEGLASPTSYTMTPSSSYDAFYLLAYAAFAAGHEPLTGPALVRAVGKLVPPGIPMDVGAAHILDVFRLLREGRGVDLMGAATSLDIDPRTGDTKSDAILHCMHDVRGTLEEQELPVVYRAQTGKWSGELACPQ
jgi:branched-chain amino acid transport system substrate-binding protein